MPSAGVVGLELLVHQRFHLMDVVGAQRDHAQVIAHELHGVVVAAELRECLEDRRILRVLDMRLERQDALGLHQLEQAELQPEQFDIGRLVVFRPAEQRAKHAERGLQHRTGIADHEGADGRPQNDHRFERLPEHLQVPAHGRVAAEHTNDDGEDADDETHETGCPDARNIEDKAMCLTMMLAGAAL